MLNFPQPPKQNQPPTPTAMGIYAVQSDPLLEWRRGIALALWGVPRVANTAPTFDESSLAFPQLIGAFQYAQKGHWKELEAFSLSKDLPKEHHMHAMEAWLEDFAPPQGSVLEKLALKLQRSGQTAPCGFLALFAAQAATFQLSLFITLLSYAFWEWRGWRMRVENPSEFIDNGEETLTLMLEGLPNLPHLIATSIANHAPTSFPSPRQP